MATLGDAHSSFPALCYFVLFVPFVVNFLVFCARISLIRLYSWVVCGETTNYARIREILLRSAKCQIYPQISPIFFLQSALSATSVDEFPKPGKQLRYFLIFSGAQKFEIPRSQSRCLTWVFHQEKHDQRHNDPADGGEQEGGLVAEGVGNPAAQDGGQDSERGNQGV